MAELKDREQTVKLPKAVEECVAALARKKSIVEEDEDRIEGHTEAMHALEYFTHPKNKADLGALLRAVDGGPITDDLRRAIYENEDLQQLAAMPDLELRPYSFSPELFVSALRREAHISHLMKEIYNAANGTCGDEAQLHLPLATPSSQKRSHPLIRLS